MPSFLFPSTGHQSRQAQASGAVPALNHAQTPQRRGAQVDSCQLRLYQRSEIRVLVDSCQLATGRISAAAARRNNAH